MRPSDSADLENVFGKDLEGKRSDAKCNHKYEKLKLIRTEGKLIFSNTGSKKYCLKMGWHISMAG